MSALALLEALVTRDFPDSARMGDAFDELTAQARNLKRDEFPEAFEKLASIVESDIPEAQQPQLFNAIFAVVATAIDCHAAGLGIPFGKRIVNHFTSKGGPQSSVRKAYTTLGVACIEANHPVEAIVCHFEERRLSIESADRVGEATAAINMSASFLQLGMYAEGVAVCQDVIARLWDFLVDMDTSPQRSTVYVNLAQCELARQRFPEALRAARQAVDLMSDPQTPTGRTRKVVRYTILAKALASMGRHAEAKDILREAAGLGERNPRAMQNLLVTQAILESFAGHHQAATETIERALQVSRDGGRLTEMQVAQAQVYELAGRFDEARGIYSRLAAQARAERLQGVLDAIRESAPAIGTSTQDAFGDLRARADAQAAIVSHFDATTSALQRLADVALLQIDPSGARAHRVGRLASALFMETGATASDASWMEATGKLLDLGYAELPRQVLTKPAPLTPTELELVRTHPVSGALMIGQDNPQLARASELVRQHHERWDGSGYPDGLAGERISFDARIVALADTFDALTHARPWRGAHPLYESVQIIEDAGGTLFDPRLVSVFSRTITRLTREHGGHLEDYLAGGAKSSPAMTLRSRLLASLSVDSAVEAGLVESHH